MKRNLTLSLLILSSLCAIAQNEDKTIAQNEDKAITLGEVVVKAAKTVNKIDGMVIYPTEAQKKSSSNGYDMLQKLSLPNIKIDATSHQVSAADNKGEVQVRINGIVAGRQEMLSLDPKSRQWLHHRDRHHRHSHFSTRRRHRIRQVEQRQE